MSISRETLERFAYNDVFVETGTHIGRCAEMAAELFGLVWSCEINEEYFEAACERCKDLDNVVLLCGDSAELLKDLSLDEPATIYLDAHGKGDKGNPLMAELAVIAEWPVRNHTIIIDDWPDYSRNRDGIEEILRGVNPDYTFRVIDGWRENAKAIVKDGLFVAEVRR